MLESVKRLVKYPSWGVAFYASSRRPRDLGRRQLRVDTRGTACSQSCVLSSASSHYASAMHCPATNGTARAE
jgi:hypothetical protein